MIAIMGTGRGVSWHPGTYAAHLGRIIQQYNSTLGQNTTESVVMLCKPSSKNQDMIVKDRRYRETQNIYYQGYCECPQLDPSILLKTQESQ